MRKLLEKFIRGYQLVISPIFLSLGCRCRFYPSCSEYAREAILVRPVSQAIFLILWRILRCGPWNKGGIDNVIGDSNEIRI